MEFAERTAQNKSKTADSESCPCHWRFFKSVLAISSTFFRSGSLTPPGVIPRRSGPIPLQPDSILGGHAMLARAVPPPVFHSNAVRGYRAPRVSGAAEGPRTPPSCTASPERSSTREPPSPCQSDVPGDGKSPPAVGVTDDSGRFVLSSLSGTGAVTGKHQVAIVKNTPVDEAPPPTCRWKPPPPRPKSPLPSPRRPRLSPPSTPIRAPVA